MKKIFIVVSFLMMMFLFGCSEAMTEKTTTIYTTTANISSDMIYFSEDLSFSNVNEANFMTFVIDDYRDIRIILDKAYLEGDVDYLPETIDQTLDSLENITIASGAQLATLVNYTSSTLNNIAKNNDITLTVQDIVGFNDLKNVVSQLDYSYRITMQEYLEARLHRQLTADESSGIDTFFPLYMSMVWNSDSYSLSGKSANEFLQDVINNTVINFTPTDDEERIITAIINVLYEINPDF